MPRDVSISDSRCKFFQSGLPRWQKKCKKNKSLKKIKEKHVWIACLVNENFLWELLRDKLQKHTHVLKNSEPLLTWFSGMLVTKDWKYVHIFWNSGKLLRFHALFCQRQLLLSKYVEKCFNSLGIQNMLFIVFLLGAKLVVNKPCYWLKQITWFVLANSRVCLLKVKLQIERPNW